MNSIHSTAIVDPRAELGTGNVIGPYCVVHGGVTIGDHNRFESHVSVGAPPEKHGFFDAPGRHGLTIGNSNQFREFVTLNTGARRPTRVGHYCVVLRGAHVSHDTILEDEVTVSCNSMIGGESYVMRGANLGMGCLLHQFSIVGAWCMLGMGTVCTKRTKMPPGGVYVGNPAKYLKPNIRRHHWGPVTDDMLRAAELRWRILQP
jgi:UDP-N-acetylglucosamine acyltransferase